MPSKVLENLTKNQYVGVGLAAVVVAVVVYFLGKKIIKDAGNGLKDLGKDAADQVAKTGDQLGELLSTSADPDGSTFSGKWYDPTQRSVFFYWLAFPEGVHHIVGGGSVMSNGTFDYDGQLFRIGYDKVGDLRAYAAVNSPDFGATAGGW